MHDTKAQPQAAETTSEAKGDPPGLRWQISALVVLAVLLLIGVAAAASVRADPPLPASAPADQFSSARATSLLDNIASVPHPTGSPAHDAVRTYLLEHLRALGLEPEAQSRTAQRPSASGRPWVASVSNIHARIPGYRPTGRVLIMAHYDSVPAGPGASDDGANVAAVLEVVRALQSGPQPLNDIDVLFTDAEEAGLLGAQGFVDSGAAGDPARVVAVNLEARGVSGPAVLFQTAGEGLVPAVVAAGAVTTSLASAVYDILPNDTDLSVLGDAGMRGLNLAFMEGSAHYHTPHDDIAHVEDASVQSMGDAALAAVRELASSDLQRGGPATATYFSVFGGVVSYPAWIDLPLAILVFAGWIGLLWAGRRYGLRTRGVLVGAGTFPVVLAAAVVVGSGGWWLLTSVRPDFANGLGDVYPSGPLALAESAVVLAVATVWYRWIRGKAALEEVALGVLGWSAVLGVLLAVFLPGGAYLFLWPTLAGVLAIGTALRYTTPASALRMISGAVAAVPAMVLILPVILLLLPALGLRLSAAPLLLAVLLAAPALGLLEPFRPRRWIPAGAAALVLASVVLVAVHTGRSGYDARHPQAVSLAYLWEGDSASATWISSGDADQPQVGSLLSAEKVDFGDRVPNLGGEQLSNGPAPTATTVELPSVQTLSADSAGGERTVRIHLQAPEDTYFLDVYVDSVQRSVVGANVDAVPLTGGRNGSDTSGPWGWGFRYVAPPRDGIDLLVRVSGVQPLRLRLVSTVPGLPDGVGAPSLRSDISWTGWPDLSAETVAVKTFEV